MGGPGVAGKNTVLRLRVINTGNAHTAYRIRFTAVGTGDAFTTDTDDSGFIVTMDGTEICTPKFTEPFDLDICGAYAKNEAR